VAEAYVVAVGTIARTLSTYLSQQFGFSKLETMDTSSKAVIFIVTGAEHGAGGMEGQHNRNMTRAFSRGRPYL
jgi:hypothetical protein